MDKLSDIIGKRLNQHQLGESAQASRIILEANHFLHDRLGCNEDDVRAFRLKDGVLYVGTTSSVWSQEVFYRRTEMLKEIRAGYGKKAVLRIVIKSLTTK